MATMIVRPPEELAERLRNAVFFIGRGLTVNGVLVDALEKAVRDLERKHNGGEPFPARTGKLTNRPVGVKTPRKKKGG